MNSDPDPANFDLPPSVQIVAGLAFLAIVGAVGYVVFLALMRGVQGIRDFGGE